MEHERAEYSKAFLIWYGELQDLASEADMQWLISSTPAQHLHSYRQGFSPEQELGELEELAQWQGCACGA